MERGLCDVGEKVERDRLMRNMANQSIYLRRKQPSFVPQSFFCVNAIDYKGKFTRALQGLKTALKRKRILYGHKCPLQRDESWTHEVTSKYVPSIFQVSSKYDAVYGKDVSCKVWSNGASMKTHGRK